MTAFRNKKLKTSKIRAFLLFLLLATLFWGLTKFSKDYATTLEIPLHYTNLPDNTLLSSKNIGSISFEVNATGFDLLLYKLRKSSLEINISKYHESGQESVILGRSDLMKEITEQVNDEMSIKNISVSELRIMLESLTFKKVPIIADTELSFKEGYKATDSIRVTPDSVTVTGSKEQLQGIDSVVTRLFSRKNIEETFSEKITLQVPEGKNVQLTPHVVSLQMEVLEFTQKQLTVPVSVLNVPEGVKIKLIPSEVVITFDVSLTNFNSISKNDFEIRCDFNNRNKDENFMVPEIIKKPEHIVNIELSEETIDFLIFK